MNTSYLDNLQAYNTCPGNYARLDLARDIYQAGIDFYYKGYAVPSSLPANISNLPRTQLNSLETYTEQISVPPGSIITAVSAWTEQPAGFTVQILDISSGVSVYNTQDIRASLLGNFEGVGQDQPAGPSWVATPLFVLDKGQLKVTLKNLAVVSNMVQLFLEFAIPNTQTNTNRKEVM